MATAIQSVSHDALCALTSAGLRAVIGERVEQVDRHGHTAAHDQAHPPAELVAAAACYAATAHDQLAYSRTDYRPADTPENWPWEAAAWKCRDPRTNLVKAGALILAAIDRMDNAPRDAGDVA